MIHLRGHAALITGSTQGVGRSIAEAFAQAGCDVVLHGKTIGPEADAAVQACKKHGVRVELFAADLTGPVESTIAKVSGEALRLMPGIDILVNNAGALFDVPFLEMDV